MKHTKLIALFGAISLSLSFLFTASAAFAAGATAAADCEKGYCPLTTIVPGIVDQGKPVNPVKVVSNIYGISIAIAAILAVIMIVWAGVEYATTEAITGKSDAKDKWTGAIWGLVLLLSSYLILRTINISLVNINLDLGKPAVASGEGVTGGALAQAESIAATNASTALSDFRAASQKVADAQAALDKATTPAEKAAAQAALDQAKRNTTVAQINALGTQATLDATKAINAGETAMATDILNKSLAAQTETANQITDPAAKTAALNQVTVNTWEARATIMSTSMLNGLANGEFPVNSATGPADFQAARAKFLSETSQAMINLRAANDPQLIKTYNDYALAKLRAIDQQWAENLKKCPNGSTVQGGCNQ